MKKAIKDRMGLRYGCCSRCNYGKCDEFTYQEWVEIGKVIRRMREEKLALKAVV